MLELLENSNFTQGCFADLNVIDINLSYVFVVVALFKLLDSHLLARNFVSRFKHNAVCPK